MSVFLKIILSLFILNISTFVYAGVTIQGTRIIFPAHSKGISVQLENQFETPALVQVWLDNGNMNEMPDAKDIPFILTPVLSRVEPKKGQSIRILPLDVSMLSKDRESIFYFNMLDIPPEDLKSDSNYLSFNVRTRIKLFYRPEALKMTQEKAFAGIVFKYNQEQKQLNIENPSPYFMNFSKFIFNPDHQATKVMKAMMIAPYSSQTITLDQHPHEIRQVQYFLVNDLGGEIAIRGAVTPIRK